MYCDCHVAALFVLKNRFIDHHDDQLSSDLLIWSIEFWFVDLIDDLQISDVLQCIQAIFSYFQGSFVVNCWLAFENIVTV